MSGTTLAAMLAAAAERLAAAGIEDFRREARLLLAAATGWDDGVMIGHLERALGVAQVATLDGLLEQRCRRVPMAQVLGQRGFWTHDFRVTADTLTPRPESELLIEAALARAGAPRRVLDFGTGTGCLLLTLLAAWPDAWGLGVDRSAAALVVARENARNLELEDRAAFLQADWAAPLHGSFDVVVANPPYIEAGVIDGLEPEVARHEPRLALDGGTDGLDAYRLLLPALPGLLAPGGMAFFEHGAGQRGVLAQLAAVSGVAVIDGLDDLAGHDRCLVLTAGNGDKR